ncbi:hypothetical protein [Chlamydiifrater volucris]|uniref:hypothetical protein n=1 Tax=Chlamydiifrater volucris TaxID=2681470 RepID=UPI001BCCCC36|nr:hypothetical protein [Chlamydiifrater volucris]
MGVKSAKEQSGKKQESIKSLMNELAFVKKSYEEEKAKLLKENAGLSLQMHETAQIFDVTRKNLEDLQKKYSYLEVDFKILSEQKESWLGDYAVLHREYVQVSDQLGMLNVSSASEEKVGIQEKDPKNQKIVSVLEEQLLLKDSVISELSQKQEDWNQKKLDLEKSNQQLTIDIDGLKKLLDGRELEIKELQDKLNSLKQQLLPSSRIKVSGERSSVDEGKVDYKALYLQLRLQFTEKDKALSSVRKEFFLLKEKLLKREKVDELTLGEENFEELGIVEQLTSKVSALELEVTHLEELISRILLQ